MSNTVSIHPYFKVHKGKLDSFKALLPKFIEKTATEEKCLYYDFSINGDVVHCREAYVGGAGALDHLQNVGELIEEALKISDLDRLEIHGPADELEKIKPALEDLNPEWFAHERGVSR